MSTMSHPPTATPERQGWSVQLLVTELWASVAIVAMWIAVAGAAVWAPNFESSSDSGTNSTTIPSAIAVAVFASFGTWAVAKYGFGQRRDKTD